MHFATKGSQGRLHRDFASFILPRISGMAAATAGLPGDVTAGTIPLGSCVSAVGGASSLGGGLRVGCPRAGIGLLGWLLANLATQLFPQPAGKPPRLKRIIGWEGVCANHV